MQTWCSRPLCNGFTLVQIIFNPGGKCAFCVKANRKHIWAQIKRMITTLYALYPLLGPQGSHSVCLGTFSLAAFGWTGWEKDNNYHPQNPQQRMRAVETDNLQGCTILQKCGAPNFTVERLPGETSWGPHRGLCWVCVRKCLTSCRRGIPALISISSKLPTQWVMKNGICTKWKEKALFL